MIISRPILSTVATLAIVAADIASVGAEPRTITSTASSKDAEMAKRAKELEAVALQILLAPMFNSNRKGLMGTGTAGRHWETMMVEHIARQIAKQGGLRLIPSVRKAGPVGAGTVAGLRKGPPLARCTAGVCAPAVATIGGWRTTVAHADAPEASEQVPPDRARDKTERNP